MTYCRMTTFKKHRDFFLIKNYLNNVNTRVNPFKRFTELHTNGGNIFPINNLQQYIYFISTIMV